MTPGVPTSSPLNSPFPSASFTTVPWMIEGDSDTYSNAPASQCPILGPKDVPLVPVDRRAAPVGAERDEVDRRRVAAECHRVRGPAVVGERAEPGVGVLERGLER